MKTLISTSLKQNKNLFILDQSKLPAEKIWIPILSPEEMATAIKELKIRGAPLIGIAATLSLALYCEQGASQEDFKNAAQKLKNTRPTGINLSKNIDHLLNVKYEKQIIVPLAESFFEKDVLLCEKISKHGASLIQKEDSLLTYCNTGGLATAGSGTAFGILIEAHKQKKNIHVYISETRPLLQGGRLSVWELQQSHIPYTLICDNMAAELMLKKKIDKVFVGADCIAKNGDTANKIGTYALAVLCSYHKIPFYVAAPKTSFNPEYLTGESIPIEQRTAQEVSQWTASVYNPAFDVTPHSLITGWIFEDGLVNRF